METEDQEIILRVEENFYKALYESSNINIASPESNTFFENELIKPISEENANICEGKTTKEECKKALNEMGTGKSPGSDGLTSEFYKCFWDEVGDDVSTTPLTKENCRFVRLKEALSLFYQRKTNPPMF